MYTLHYIVYTVYIHIYTYVRLLKWGGPKVTKAVSILSHGLITLFGVPPV